MIRTKNIKVWTLLTYALIVIGMGHGILILGIAEPLWLTTIFQEPKSAEAAEVSDAILQLVALMSLLGQIAVVISIYAKVKTTETSLHIIGLLLLWSALLTYIYGIRNDNGSHLVIVTCLPFLYFTILTLFGKHLQKLWKQVFEI